MKSPCYLVTLSLESSDFQTFLKQYVILVPSLDGTPSIFNNNALHVRQKTRRVLEIVNRGCKIPKCLTPQLKVKEIIISDIISN